MRITDALITARTLRRVSGEQMLVESHYRALWFIDETVGADWIGGAFGRRPTRSVSGRTPSGDTFKTRMSLCRNARRRRSRLFTGLIPNRIGSRARRRRGRYEFVALQRAPREARER